ncbi:hypothetical protein, partial [Hymenobacter agri]
TVEHPRSGADARLAVYNLLGQRVATAQPTAGGVATPLSLNALARGSYLVVYTDAHVSLTARCTRE